MSDRGGNSRGDREGKKRNSGRDREGKEREREKQIERETGRENEIERLTERGQVCIIYIYIICHIIRINILCVLYDIYAIGERERNQLEGSLQILGHLIRKEGLEKVALTRHSENKREK